MRGFLAREWFRTLRETHLIEEERWRVQQLRERELLQLACANEVSSQCRTHVIVLFHHGLTRLLLPLPFLGCGPWLPRTRSKRCGLSESK